MTILTRSASATHSNASYLTPQTPHPPAHPRALIDMTPLPSLFDKIVEASKDRKRSTPLQLGPKVDDPFALPSIPEEPDYPSSYPLEFRGVQTTSGVPTEVADNEVCDVQNISYAPTEIGDELESEPVVHQPSATSDPMDYEDTPIVFGPLNPTSPPAPIISSFASFPVPPFVCEDVVMSFSPSSQLHTFQHPEPPVTQ
jgi:hypothetical protein